MRLARILRRDIDAVNNAIELPWSKGQAEGQINRPKTLKRAIWQGRPRIAEGSNAASPPHKVRKNLINCHATGQFFGDARRQRFALDSVDRQRAGQILPQHPEQENSRCGFTPARSAR